MNSRTRYILQKSDFYHQKRSSINSIKQLSFTLFIVLSALLTYSQPNNRAEINLQESQACYVYPLKTYGVLVQSEITPKSGKNETVKLEYYDINLVKQKTDSFEILKCSDYNASFQRDALNYVLKWEKGNKFSLISTDFNGYKSSVFTGELPSQIIVYQFVVLGKYLYIRCSISKQNTLLQINLETKKQIKLPLRIQDVRRGDLYSKDLKVLGDELLVFVQAEISAKSTDLYMFKYTLEGKLLKTINLTRDINEIILEIQASIIDGNVILSGTYSKTSTEFSQGVFFAELKSDNVVNPRFYNFLQLKKFAYNLSEKSQGAIDRKNEKLENKNVELLINTLAVVHAVQKTSDGYLLACEFYKPDVMSSMFIFYTHAVLLKLNKKGDLLWDESIKIEKIGSNSYVRAINVSINVSSSGDINMSFAKADNHIITKSLDMNGKVLKEKTLDITSFVNIETKAKRYYSTIDAWYDDNFIASGVLKVASKTSGGKRNIFFLQKLNSNN